MTTKWASQLNAEYKAQQVMREKFLREVMAEHTTFGAAAKAIGRGRTSLNKECAALGIEPKTPKPFDFKDQLNSKELDLYFSFWEKMGNSESALRAIGRRDLAERHAREKAKEHA